MDPVEIGAIIIALVFGALILKFAHDVCKVEPPKYTPIDSHPRLSPPTDSSGLVP